MGATGPVMYIPYCMKPCQCLSEKSEKSERSVGGDWAGDVNPLLCIKPCQCLLEKIERSVGGDRAGDVNLSFVECFFTKPAV